MTLARYRQQQRDQFERDAEHILEDIMHRQNWQAETRDQLADALERVAMGEKLSNKPKTHRNGGAGRGSARA